MLCEDPELVPVMLLESLTCVGGSRDEFSPLLMKLEIDSDVNDFGIIGGVPGSILGVDGWLPLYGDIFPFIQLKLKRRFIFSGVTGSASFSVLGSAGSPLCFLPFDLLREELLERERRWKNVLTSLDFVVGASTSDMVVFC